MNRLKLLVVLLFVLAGCSSVQRHTPEREIASAPTVDIIDQPLQIPNLNALPETPVRALSGKYVPVSFSVLPGWSDDSLQNVWKAFINNCKGLMRPVAGGLTMPARAAPRVWQPVCAAAQQSGLNPSSASTQEVRQFIEQHLQPWRLADSSGSPAKNTVTGYYEPLVYASRNREGNYQWPLYSVPSDLLTIDLGSVYPELAGKRVRGKLEGKRVVPYDTRAQIAQAPERQPEVIVWVNDPVEAFFLQIQGSGRAQLPNGSMIRLAYADHNGQPYSSIAQWLVNQGQITLAQASMANIKKWASNNPHRVQEMLNANSAMVFFKEESISDPALGPKGAYGISLMQERSIAVDPSFTPLGTPVYLATTFPSSNKPLQRLVFAQDTGAAIKGAARSDFYWGFGEQAGALAGRMKQSGEVWLLWPKGAGAPTAR